MGATVQGQRNRGRLNFPSHSIAFNPIQDIIRLSKPEPRRRKMIALANISPSGRPERS